MMPARAPSRPARQNIRYAKVRTGLWRRRVHRARGSADVRPTALDARGLAELIGAGVADAGGASYEGDAGTFQKRNTVAMALSAAEAVRQLKDRSSPKRRAAAKALRRLKDPSAGPDLLEALKTETRDPRTWETQYQMVMALAECSFVPARGWLMEFATGLDDPSMLTTGVGDAVVRLSFVSGMTDDGLAWALRSKKGSIVDGALRALAMTGAVPDATLIDEILVYLAPLPAEDGGRFWAAVAAVDWPGHAVRSALTKWASLSRADVADAARLSLGGTHAKHTPL